MAVTFAATIKPYFTECYREHMLDFFDLWVLDNVKDNWDIIFDRCRRPPSDPKSMPRPGCPEGVWDDATRQRFLQDFQDWKAGGFQ
jgi:hypothetical protein